MNAKRARMMRKYAEELGISKQQAYKKWKSMTHFERGVLSQSLKQQ